MERPAILTESHVREIGKAGYSEYAYQAQNSDVPAEFFRTSRTLSLDLFADSSWTQLADLLLGGGFETEDEAFAAIRYAEAISKLKSLDRRLESGDISPELKKEIEETQLAVGLSLLNEKDEEGSYATKLSVEEYFEEPVNRMKILFLSTNIEGERVQ